MPFFKAISTRTGSIILAIALIISGGILFYAFVRGDLVVSESGQVVFNRPTDLTPGGAVKSATLKTIKKFSSEQEFKKFLSDHPTTGYGYGGGMERAVAVDMVANKGTMPSAAPMSAEGGGGETAARVSETNVQVAGIDEPDLVKTDGREIYISSEYMYWRPMVTPMFRAESDIGIMPPYENSGATKIARAFPISEMKLDGKIEKGGQLLLYKNILAIFDQQNRITAFDTTNPAEPKEKWRLKLSDRGWLAASRLMGGTLYLAVAESVNISSPCPLKPIIIGDNKEVSVACSEIYYPTVETSADTTYSLLAVDALTGEVKKKTSFLGASGQSIFYMSPEAAYLTYSYQGDLTKFAYGFFSENKDLVAGWVIEKLAKLMNYDLSENAKMTELSDTLNKYIHSLDQNEALKFQNEAANRLSDYFLKHRRELSQTGIVKINLKDLVVSAAGSVPGQPLNQFSLDEYQGNLRIATTIGSDFWGLGSIGFSGQRQTVSDVYVLDSGLKISGSVKGLGEEERIYSVRFLEDRGYVVTFRQTDPFYVLDLSSATKPLLRGELKIPGFSSYLHPLPNHQVLGVGREGGSVKLSIFDVKDPANPKEAAKYLMNEYWSEALDNHHAFLLDEKHGVFFLPGGQGGYVFSYINNELKMVFALNDSRVSRAIYLDDYLYIVSEGKLTAVDEKTWQVAKELDLN